MEKRIKVYDCDNLMTYIGELVVSGENVVLKNFISLPTDSSLLHQYEYNKLSLTDRLKDAYKSMKKSPGKISLEKNKITTRYELGYQEDE